MTTPFLSLKLTIFCFSSIHQSRSPTQSNKAYLLSALLSVTVKTQNNIFYDFRNRLVDLSSVTYFQMFIFSLWFISQLCTKSICWCYMGAQVEASPAVSSAFAPLPSVFMCPFAWARRLCDRSPAPEARHVPARRSDPLSLMPRLARGPYGSTRQITLPLSHHFSWQKCSPPHYFALSFSTPQPALVLQPPPISPASPPAPAFACLRCSTKLSRWGFAAAGGLNPHKMMHCNH